MTSPSLTFIDGTTKPKSAWFQPVNDTVYAVLADVGGNAPTTKAQLKTNLGYASTTGDETLAGVKTFASSPLIPNATLPGQAAAFGQMGGRLLGIRIFTTADSGSTYTPTSGTNAIIAVLVGGGGAGGGTPLTGAGQLAVSSGGGSAPACAAYFTSGFSGKTLTIGVGGVASVGANGGVGGQTAIGTIIITLGGRGGYSGPVLTPTDNYVQTAADGQSRETIAIGGQILWSYAGVPGANGYVFTGGVGGAIAGVGASGTFGQGGNTTHVDASGYGAGGSGIYRGASSAAAAGGNGAPGVIIIYEYA